jgi:hypothetical protein
MVVNFACHVFLRTRYANILQLVEPKLLGVALIFLTFPDRDFHRRSNFVVRTIAVSVDLTPWMALTWSRY